MFSSFISDTDTQDYSSCLRQFENCSMRFGTSTPFYPERLLFSFVCCGFHRQGDARGDGTADEVVTKIPGLCLNSCCMVFAGNGPKSRLSRCVHTEFPDSEINIDIEWHRSIEFRIPAPWGTGQECWENRQGTLPLGQLGRLGVSLLPWLPLRRTTRGVCSPHPVGSGGRRKSTAEVITKFTNDYSLPDHHRSSMMRLFP